MKKNDLKLIFGILITALIFLAVLFAIRRNGAEVVVRINGEETASYPLSEDAEYTVSGYGGGTNELVIENGAAYLSDADCPDKLCVKMGKIRYDGETIVCLPHKVVIEIQGGRKASYDTSGDAVTIDAETGGSEGRTEQ